MTQRLSDTCGRILCKDPGTRVSTMFQFAIIHLRNQQDSDTLGFQLGFRTYLQRGQVSDSACLEDLLAEVSDERLRYGISVVLSLW